MLSKGRSFKNVGVAFEKEDKPVTFSCVNNTSTKFYKIGFSKVKIVRTLSQFEDESNKDFYKRNCNPSLLVCIIKSSI
jgi:hypothetical protein